MVLKKGFIPALIVFILGFFLLFLFGWSEKNNNHRIFVSGNIELKQIDIAFKTSGRLIELTVDEGDDIKQGTLLARLDQDELLHQRDRACAAVVASEARIAQLNTAMDYLRETLEAQTAQRKAELAQVETGLKELLAGSRKQEIEKTKASVDKTRTEYEQAQRDWERASVLYEKGDISTARYDQFKTHYESTGALLTQAENQFDLVLEGPRKEDIEAAYAQVDRARAGLRLAEAQRLEIKRKKEELLMAGAELDSAKAEVAIIDSKLNDMVAFSPIDGMVMVKAAETGEILPAGMAFLTVGDLGHPWLRGYIGERDLDRVSLGAKAKVKTDSGKVFWGRLAFIASDAEFTPKQIQTKEERVKLVYRIKIEIENPRGELKLNMPVEAEILLD